MWSVDFAVGSYRDKVELITVSLLQERFLFKLITSAIQFTMALHTATAEEASCSSCHNIRLVCCWKEGA